jgi:DNA mismatch endonuclease (patch repair protein)
MDRALREILPDGGFRDVSPARSRAMGKVRGKGNRTTERRLRSALVSAGIRGWRLHAKDMPGCPDFYFARERLAVFVDGCFWHGCRKCGHVPKTNSVFWKKKLERNRMRDRRQRRMLERQGIVVVRFWEHELRTSLMDCVEKVRAGIERGGPKARA